MKVLHTLDPELRRNLLILFTAGLLFWSSLASLLPTLPLYIEDIGANSQQIGIIMGSFAIGMLMFRPWCSDLADRRGRKIVLLIGMSTVAIAPLGYLLARSIIPLMVLRAFHGISLAAFGTAYIALVGDLAPSKNRGEIIGYMSLVNPIGAAIGPALGGYLQAVVGYTPLFLVSAALGFAGMLCIVPIVNPSINEKLDNNADDNLFWRLLLTPRVRIPAIVMLLIGMVLGTLHTFVPLFIKSTNIDLNPGLFYTVAAVASFNVRLFIGRASDRYGRGLFITLSLIAFTLSMIGIWQANSAPVFLLSALVEGAASGTAIPMMAVMMTDRARPHERGRIFGVSLVGLDIGIGIAGPALGAIAEQVGYRHMFGYAAGLTLLATMIFLTQSSHNLTNSLRFALGRAQDSYSSDNGN
ncbi:MFS transporter [Umezakia ovalisporum]|uniref:MFS transporter n=4 Tax=Umezakia ovalisporum TaxID=75695 RepID=A0AA43GXP9_9CYAN|nr:MFS transporter [Umezakia ovalisporum]MDH6055273.1 MFS transporter [Umezakia ovalisporum FSS-43]MDH6063385.1 MFS transporter [Umezakia ovalisporum FSS-62]MDH6066624.1 MFS transporter [Umezakia ovalisporum APH033B]MDH6071772.1 MFS transporter [Umezakia ovalisporum CobakiLakeA]MDH6072805.1 MFS transporter [Umezakia ovalisporum CS-1034]